MININVGTYDGKLLGFSLDEQFSNNKTLYSFQASTSLIKSVYRSGRFLYVGGSEELVKVYDVRRRIEVSLLEQHSGTINQILGHTNFLFTASDDGLVNLWKTKQWALLNKFECSSPVVSVCVHPSGKVLACVTKDKKLHLFNLMNLKRLALKKFHFTIEKVHFISKDNEIQYLLFQSDRKCYIVDCETNKVAYTIDIGAQITDSIYDEQLIISDSNGIIYLIKISDLSHKLIVKFKAHNKRVKQLQSFYSKEQPYLASISSDGEIKIWDCLLYTTDEYDEIDLQNKLKPLITIMTNQRLTCLSVVIDEQEKVEQIEEVKPILQLKKPLVNKQRGVTKQIKKK